MRPLRMKLTSRKFLAALAGLIAGLALAFGADAAVVRTVAGAVVSVGSVVAYIITEGRVDAAHAVKAAESVVKAVEAVADGEPDGGLPDGQTEQKILPGNQ